MSKLEVRVSEITNNKRIAFDPKKAGENSFSYSNAFKYYFFYQKGYFFILLFLFRSFKKKHAQIMI